MELITSHSETDLFFGKYESENEIYQDQLNQVYNGKVRPIEKYINHRAAILHTCTQCNGDFYAKPLWLLSKSQPHDCNRTGTVSNRTKKKLSDTEKNEIIKLYVQGISQSKIASSFGVNRKVVAYQLKKAGVK